MPDQGHLSNANSRIDNVWIHRVALLTSALTVVLIFVGGLVTNTGSALAVPDWPTTFGYNMFLYPWSKMVGGILYEHSHRLIGSVVGLLTLTLALSLWLKEPRRSLRWLGTAALGAVILQGVLGGLRVVIPSAGLEFAAIHGCLAQAFFALMVTITFSTSAEWSQRPLKAPVADAGALKRLCLLVTFLMYLQIVFGAMLTHRGSFLHAHLLVATLVAIHVGLLATRIIRRHSDQSMLTRPVGILSGLLAAQVLLGIGSYLARSSSIELFHDPLIGLALPTTHRVIGALLLASSIVLTLRAYRLRSSPQGVASRGFVADQVGA